MMCLKTRCGTNSYCCIKNVFFRLQPKIKLQKLNVDINNEISLNLNLEQTSETNINLSSGKTLINIPQMRVPYIMTFNCDC